MPKETVPTREVLMFVMKVAETTIEAAEYLVEKCTAIALQEFADFVKMKLTPTGDAWKGIEGETSDYRTLQENIARNASERLAKMVTGGLQLEIALNEAAQILRGYTEKGETPDPEVVKEIDSIFSSWLAKNNMVSRGSTLYETDSSGQLKVDSQGKPVSVDLNKIKSLLTDPAKGFKKFMAEKGFQLTIQEREFPKETPKPEKTETQDKTILPAVLPEPSKDQSSEPDQPHSTIG